MEFSISVQRLLCVRRWHWLIVPVVMWFCIDSVYAAVPAGTVIKNQASATYRDANGVLRTTTSNIVETLIQQVAALQLAQDQSRPAMAERQVLLTHTITNTGNGSDSFSLIVQNESGDDFDFSALTIFADADQNGQADVLIPVTVSPVLGMLESWSFVIVAQVPGGVAANDTASLQVRATSDFDAGVTDTNSDQLTITDGAVIEMVKSVSETSGLSGGGPFLVTLSYSNTGASDAVNVTLIDALPAGMEYVANSARWSGTGAVALSDDDSNSGADSDPRIQYCAYHASCIGLAEAIADSDSDSTNQVTAIVTSVAPGDVGQVTFEVVVSGGLNAATLFNTAEFEYTTNTELSARLVTNTVAFDVLQQPAVVLNGSISSSADGAGEPLMIASMSQGEAVSFGNMIWNIGNDSDVFDITLDIAGSTFPPGSLYRLLQSDGATPLLDTNGNGVPDTGPVPASGRYTVVLMVIPPAQASGDNSGAGYEISMRATSLSDTAVFNEILNQLVTISTASVDITNDASLPDANATGVGIGPESDPVNTFGAMPGAPLSIDFYVNNTGQGQIDLELMASTDPDFSNPVLPDDWAVAFHIAGEDDPVTSTGVIEAGSYQLVTALITIPEDAEPADVSIYFQARSEVTGATDIKHDSLSISATPQLLLELNQDGQTAAGGSYTYHHTLRNTGNTSLSGIALAATNEVSGWSSILYGDYNGNGVLDAPDQTLNVIATLNAGEVATVFVKVFAPSGAAAFTTNQTTLTANWGGGAYSIDNVVTTTVASVEISIIKEQAPDIGCTGVPDGAYSIEVFAVEPGNNCVSYRLTATNDGLGSAYNVEIADATPAFTAYFGVASCSHGSCSVAEPAAGGQGNVIATIPELGAGDIVTLNFSVRIE